MAETAYKRSSLTTRPSSEYVPWPTFDVHTVFQVMVPSISSPSCMVSVVRAAATTDAALPEVPRMTISVTSVTSAGTGFSKKSNVAADLHMNVSNSMSVVPSSAA